MAMAQRTDVPDVPGYNVPEATIDQIAMSPRCTRGDRETSS